MLITQCKSGNEGYIPLNAGAKQSGDRCVHYTYIDPTPNSEPLGCKSPSVRLTVHVAVAQ
jgi:hypothetical protein